MAVYSSLPSKLVQLNEDEAEYQLLMSKLLFVTAKYYYLKLYNVFVHKRHTLKVEMQYNASISVNNLKFSINGHYRVNFLLLNSDHPLFESNID